MFEQVVVGSFERARVICVERASVAKWLALTAASWLAYLGTGQANASGNFPSGLPTPNWSFEVWISIAAAATAILLVVWVLLTWLRSHGQAMFLDLVARDSDDLRASWTATGPLANDLFRTRLVVDFAGFALFGLLVGAGGGASWTMGATSSGDPKLWAPLALGGAAAMLLAIGWSVVTFLLDELVLPLAYARREAVREAAGALRLLDLGQLVAYVGIRFLAAIVVAILAAATSCLLCVVAWLPFVSALILLPFRVYLQSLPLAFLYRADPERCGVFAPVT